jgi:hypothetical protein
LLETAAAPVNLRRVEGSERHGDVLWHFLLDGVELLDHPYRATFNLFVNELNLVDHLRDLDHLDDLLLFGLGSVDVLFDGARLLDHAHTGAALLLLTHDDLGLRLLLLAHDSLGFLDRL